MNNTFKRILHIVVMSLAVITLVMSSVGIVGAWVVRTELNQTLDVVSRLSVTALQRAGIVVARIDPPLARAQTLVQRAEAQVRDAGQKVNDTNLVISGAELLLDKDLSPAINTLTTTVLATSDALQSAEDTLNALSRMPFIDGETGIIGEARLLIEELQSIGQSMIEARQALQARKEEAVQTVVESLTTPLEQLSARLTALSNRSQAVQGRLSNTEARVPVIASQAKSTITMVVLVVTLALVWTIISQIIVFRYSLDRYRMASRPQ